MLESEFKNKIVKRDLDKLPNFYYLTKEALAIRGIPDIIFCANGRFGFLELKRSKKGVNSARSKLQEHVMNTARKAGAYASFAYPENWEHVLAEITSLCA